MSNAADTVISVRGLMNAFGSQIVHKDLDIDVYQGEVLGVIGGSGSGKSVLLRSIAGLRRPNAGKVTLLENDLWSLSETQRQVLERRSGILFQHGALFSSLTVLENVRLPLVEYSGLSDSLINELAMLKIRLTGLESAAAHKYPSQLSGGMQKRAALARALALDPEILFLDEPTAGLDPIGAAAFDELVATLQAALGLTVFIVTHDLDTLYAVCNRVAVLAEQKVLVEGPLEKVQNHPHPWIQEYFHGPRARAAQKSSTLRHQVSKGL